MPRWPLTPPRWAPTPFAETPDERVLTFARLRVGPFVIGLRAYRSDFHQPLHARDLAQVDFNLAGGGRGLYAGTDATSRPGDIEPYAPNIPHSFQSGPEGIRTMHLSIARAALPPEWRSRTDAPRERHHFDEPAAIRAALALLNNARAPRDADAAHTEAVAWELFHTVFAPSTTERRTPTVRRAVELLHDTPSRTVGLAELASACDVHRGTLARVFRAHTGTTPGAYHRRLRTAHAVRLLALGVPAARAALDAGFADQPHLVRTLQSCCGTTPTRFTKQLGTARSRSI
ncbi:MAG: helix-turn-helix domain-containing protein [Phycisphaerales bacterium]